MTNKSTFFLIAVLITIGIGVLVLVSSLMIKSPAMLAGLSRNAQTITATTKHYPTIEILAPLPIYTATSVIENPTPVTDTNSSAHTLPTKISKFTTTPTSIETTDQTVTQQSLAMNCGRNDTVLIIVGLIDEHSNHPASSIPVLRYVKIDFSSLEIKILSVPDNLLLSGRTIDRLKLSSLTPGEMFEYTESNLADQNLVPQEVGINAIAQALFDVTGLIPGYFLLVSSDNFMDLVDELGGLNAAIITSDQQNGAAEKKIDAEQSWQQLQNSEPQTGLHLDAQNRVLKAIEYEIKQPAFIEKIPEMVTKFQNVALTNLQNDAILQIICALRAERPSDTIYLSMQPYLQPVDDKFVSVIDIDSLIVWLEKNY